LLSADATRLAQFTKNLNTTTANSLELTTKTKTNITKREIILDSDPDIVNKMSGKEARLEQERVKKAEEVYRFARQVVDIVGNDSGIHHKNKTKRQTQEQEELESEKLIKGMWAALGTSPEFVPDLVKRATAITKTKAVGKKRMSLAEIRQKRTDVSNKRRKFSVIQDTVSEDAQNINNKRSLLQNQHHVESPVSMAETGSLGTVNFINNNKRSTILKHVESPVSVTETGNLGTVYFKEATSSETENSNNSDKREKSKRQDADTETDINRVTFPTSSAEGGKVIFAFDEVKELMPSRTLSNAEENKLLLPQTFTETPYDIDKDLADSMLVSRENIPSKPAIMSAVLIPTHRKFVPLSDQSEFKNKIPILKKDARLGPAQISKYRSDYEKPRIQQMQQWVNETMLHPLSNEQTAETDAALQKLNLASLNATYPSYTDNKGETSSEYLAKNLQDKIKEENQGNEIDVDELNSDIVKEQGKYKVYMDQQRQQRLLQQQQQQQQQGDDSETQSESTQNLNPYLPTTTATPTTNITTLPQTNSPSLVETGNQTIIPSTTITTTTPQMTLPSTFSNESALEHFERVHGYNNESLKHSQDDISTTPTTPVQQAPITSTTTTILTTNQLTTTTTTTTTTTSTIPATKTPIPVIETTTYSSSKTTSATLTTDLTTEAATSMTTPPTTTITTTLNATAPPYNTLNIQQNTSIPVSEVNYNRYGLAVNQTVNNANANNATLPEVIPVLEKNDTSNRMNVVGVAPNSATRPPNSTTRPQNQSQQSPGVAQQYLSAWQQSAPKQIVVATASPPVQPIQSAASSATTEDWQQKEADVGEIPIRTAAAETTGWDSGQDPTTPMQEYGKTTTLEGIEQQELKTPLPYPLEVSFKPEIVLPKNTSALAIIPRTDGKNCSYCISYFISSFDCC